MQNSQQPQYASQDQNWAHARTSTSTGSLSINLYPRPENHTPPPTLKREDSTIMSDHDFNTQAGISSGASQSSNIPSYHHNHQQGWPLPMQETYDRKRHILMRSTSEPSLYNSAAGAESGNHHHHHHSPHLPAYTYDRQENSPAATASPELHYSTLHSVANSPVESGSPQSSGYVLDGAGLYYNIQSTSHNLEYPNRSYPNPHLLNPRRKISAPSLPPISHQMTYSHSTTYNVHGHLAMPNLPVSPPPSPPDYSRGTAIHDFKATFIQSKRVKKQRKQKPLSEHLTIITSEHKIYKCTFGDCTSRFSRQEHLKRHENTHFPERRPHICPVDKCRRAFSRTDNLKQHMISHTKQGGKNRYVPGLIVD